MDYYCVIFFILIIYSYFFIYYIIYFQLKEMLMELKLKIQNVALYEEKLNIIFNELSINLTQIQQ